MNRSYYQYLMPEHPPLIEAWHARHKVEGIMHSPLLRLLLWGVADVKKRQFRDRSKGDAMACSFRGAHAERLWNEAAAADKTVREYITDRLCDELGVPRYVSVYKQRGMNRQAMLRAERRRARERAAAVAPVKVRRIPPRHRNDASPTQPAGGPYWPNPEMRAATNRVAKCDKPCLGAAA